MVDIAKNCKWCNKAFIQGVSTQEYCSVECRKKAENANYYLKHKARISQIHKNEAKKEDDKLNETLNAYKEDAIKTTDSEVRKEESTEWRLFGLPHRKDDVDKILEDAKQKEEITKEFSYQFTVYKSKLKDGEYKNLCRTMIMNVHTRREAIAYWKKMMKNKRDRIRVRMENEAKAKLQS